MNYMGRRGTYDDLMHDCRRNNSIQWARAEIGLLRMWTGRKQNRERIKRAMLERIKRAMM